jgi:hypothetical protein
MKQVVTLPNFEDCLPEAADNSVYHIAKKLDSQFKSIVTDMNTQYTLQVVQTIQNWCSRAQESVTSQAVRTARAAGQKQG